MDTKLITLKTEMQSELANILKYWQTRMIDNENGGFYGQINGQDKLIADAPKGAILNARILWTFSSAYRITQNKSYLETAQRAVQYLYEYFIDKEHGGVFWSLDSKGKPLDKKKQIYALSFAIYALSEYYRVSKDEKAKDEAIKLYHLIEKHSFDNELNGYFEAYSREWVLLEDLRLSDKDQNDKKTMNTHLHVLEAYTNLYRIWKDDNLKQQLANLINIFTDKIINSTDNHFRLFFDEDWSVKSPDVSYGHDIEGAWLIFEAAEILGDSALIEKLKPLSLKMTDAAAEGLDSDGSLMNEKNTETNHVDTDKHWWPQAEAIVGFVNAWQISENPDYLDKAINVWEFTKNQIIDSKNGEWFWRVDKDNNVVDTDDKAGFWKCPYHNGRACLEIIERIA